MPCPNVPKIFDIDGNSYNTVQIGNQCWTKENLKVTKFKDGSLIQIDESGGVTGSTTGQTWTSQTIGKRTIYANDKTKLSVYGYLYNWFVVSDSRGICPSGWHVPEREELSLLFNFLGGEKTAGSKLKEKSSTLWQNSNLENSNESGFSGIPAGIRGTIQGGYSGIGSKGVWWSSTKYDKDDAYKMELTNNSNDAKVGLTSMINGFSIRCVKDNLKNSNDSIPKISTIQITDVTSNSAQSGGSISSEGGSEIIAKGVVWSRSKRPDILTDSTTREGKGIGSFSSALSGLISGKKYYVRAYATSKYGTSYGQELSFKTLISSKLPKVETSIISDITQKSALSGGKILNDGDLDIITKGVVWSKNINPKLWLFANKTKDGNGNDNFISIIDKLSPFETYYVRAYATNSAGTGYGNELTFKTTAAAVVPTLTTSLVSSITSKTAVGGGNITSDGGTNVTVRGVVWSANPNPTVSLTTKTTNGNGIGSFASDMVDLLANTTYYVRAYATNSAGTGYGNELTFKTTPAVVVPTLTTAPVSSITSKTAVSGGNISSDGGSNVTIRGVVWSTNPNPTVSLTTKTTNGNGIGTFASDMIDLLANTTYYVRAYATNSAGTGYGNELTFKTMAAAVVPTLTTTQVTSITSKTAVSGGNISSDGGSNVTISGVVWSTNPNPTVSLTTKTTNGNGIGTFASDMIDLVANTTYYVRAYATNSAGTGYGNELTFKTTAAAVVPSLSTAPVSSITSKTAVSGGNISSDGGSNVTIRGVVWSTNPNPTVSLTTKTINGNGIGTFASDMVDLLANTTYYVRAYATNSAGTGYGNELTFKTTTAAIVQTLTTTQVISITSKSAVSGGNISSDGGSNVTTRGVVWSTNPNPTVSLTTKTTNGNGIGTFTSDIINLLANTTYYVRAYATNSAGTGYGNEISFKTLVANTEKGQPCSDIPSYKDIDGNTYNTVQIGTQCWTKENLRVSKYKDGTLIPFDESGGTTGDSLNETWSERITGARAVYGKNTQNIVTYGYLYNWYTVENPKGLCPSGWHVPSRSEFDKLITFLGGEEIAGGKMKSTGTTFWKTPNEGATNESGFSGLPGGYRDRRGKYEGISLFGAYWSSTNIDINDPEVWLLSIGSENRLVGWIDVETLEMGASIRCLKDTIINNTTSLPTLTTTSVSTITSTSANTGGNITNDGGASITARGVVWSTNPNPTVNLTTKTINGGGIGTFASDMVDLLANTTYYARAYATNSAGTGYGNELTFKTTTEEVIPLITTIAVNSITSNSAISGGYISEKFNSPIVERGIVWSKDPSPIVSVSSKTSDGSELGEFWSYISNLTNNTTYYVRAYLITSEGTFYGNELIFSTKEVKILNGRSCEGTTTIKDIDGNLYNTVQIGTQCWLRENLKVSKYNDGTDIPLDASGGKTGRENQKWTQFTTGARTVYEHDSLNLLLFGYLYNWYAARGIAAKESTNYKNLCPEGWHVPSYTDWTILFDYLGGQNNQSGKMMSTNGIAWEYAHSYSATNESGFSAFPGGFRGGNGIFQEIYYGRTIFCSSTNNENETGLAYGLLLPTMDYPIEYYGKYMGAYIRCINDNNTTNIPIISTIEINTINSNSAIAVGNINSDRGIPISSKGFVWSNKPLPTVDIISKSIADGGLGSFKSSINNLTPNTIYYLRAYATNNFGTGYGNEIIFTTPRATITECEGLPIVKDIDGNTYNTVQIGNQCWLRENLKTTKYNDGTIVPLDNSGGINGNGASQTWSDFVTGARTVYEHDAKNLTTYGYLYNGYAARGIAAKESTNYKNLCPEGWHVPSNTDWTILFDYLGGKNIAGGRMKTIDTVFWNYPNLGATNESGFSALPGGGRGTDFGGIKSSASFWVNSEIDEFYNSYSLYAGDSTIWSQDRYFINLGMSIRCIKNNNIGFIPNVKTTAVESVSLYSAKSGGDIESDGGLPILARGVVWSTSPNPTLSMTTKTTNGIGTGIFKSAMINLLPNTTYYVRAYATNSAGTSYGNDISFSIIELPKTGLPCEGLPIVKDIDGNIYNTVKIGNQCWTRENLKTTKYNDGTIIPLDNSGGINGNGTSQTWSDFVTGARTVYEHDSKNLTTYGHLYNWYAARGIAIRESTNLKNLCPEGWHVPSDTDWKKLSDYLGGENIAGGKMKSINSSFWRDEDDVLKNIGATNESGFSSIPSGIRDGDDGEFNAKGIDSEIWSSTERNDNLPISYRLVNKYIDLIKTFESKNQGLTIRCIKN